MLSKAAQVSEHVFARRSALQVPPWTEKRVGGTLTGTTSRVLIPAGATLIEISVTQDCYINFGDVTVDASSSIATDGSRLFMAGVQIVVVPEDSAGVPLTYMAAIRVSLDGVYQVEQLAP